MAQKFEEDTERLVPRMEQEPELKHIKEKLSPPSQPKLRYDLVPRRGLEALALVLTEGAKTHGEREFMRHLEDEQYLRERLNHMLEHVQKLVHPRKLDPEYDNTHKDVIKRNLGAIMFGCCVLAEALEHPEGARLLINKIIDF